MHSCCSDFISLHCFHVVVVDVVIVVGGRQVKRLRVMALRA
jgi:hypothetical protein